MLCDKPEKVIALPLAGIVVTVPNKVVVLNVPVVL